MRAILTPTGARPDAFKLCQIYLARQIIKEPVVWIVIDDGPEPSEIILKHPKIEIVYLRPSSLWRPGVITHRTNLLEGLRYAMARGGPDLKLTFWEDDDWYPSDWVEKIFNALEGFDIVGETRCRYYNVRTRRHKTLNNLHHAALRTTAISAGGIDALLKLLEKVPERQDKVIYYDLQLWKVSLKKRLYDFGLTTGIKGLPGRPGQAPGHDDKHGSIDANMSRLSLWIGKDVDNYTPFFKKEAIMATAKNEIMIALCDFPYGERGEIKEGQAFELRNNAEKTGFIRLGRARALNADELKTPIPAKKPNPPKKTGGKNPFRKTPEKQGSTANMGRLKSGSPKLEKKEDPKTPKPSQGATGDSDDKKDD